MTDEQREARIKDYTQRLINATTREEKLLWWDLTHDEIMARSPEQVRKMEEEYGFHKGR